MKMYVGVTDYDWFTLLKQQDCDEVNFWTPGARNFRALEENELFLFKLHSPRNYIVGGGFFVRSSILPVGLAWEAFEIKNGTRSYNDLYDRILKYKTRNRIDTDNPNIGCIVLTEPFFFDEKDWISAPSDWSPSIVQGKTYNTDTAIGMHLYQSVIEKLQKTTPTVIPAKSTGTSGARYSTSVTKHRIGQGAFRVLVTDAYQKRCAITGEKTLPVLQAAHIKPYASGGEHLVTNGLLLRSDLHTLFDEGYITVDCDYCVNVSKRLHDDYGNGKLYYEYHGIQMRILPEYMHERPAKEFLEWHNENVFLG